MLDLGRAQREADAPTSRSTYEQLAMLLDLRSRDVYIMLTDTKALRSTRVPMGSKNSTAALGRATSVIFADLLHELARLAAELGDAQYDNMLDKVRETTRRVEAQERERANRGKRKRALRLKPGDYVMVARKTRTSTKMEARWTGPHQVIQCHSAHRFTIRHTVTNKETVEHASFLEYYDGEIASTGEQIKTQVAHDTYGFKVSGLGNHE
jgi:hypothetical protein